MAYGTYNDNVSYQRVDDLQRNNIGRQHVRVAFCAGDLIYQQKQLGK
jgi:hypothetical protein